MAPRGGGRSGEIPQRTGEPAVNGKVAEAIRNLIKDGVARAVGGEGRAGGGVEGGEGGEGGEPFVVAGAGVADDAGFAGVEVDEADVAAGLGEEEHEFAIIDAADE